MASFGARVRAFMGRQTYNYYAASARYYADHGHGVKPILHLYAAAMIAGILTESAEHNAKEYNSEYKHRKDVIAAHSAECAAEERELVELDRKALSESAFRGRKGQLPECVTITKNGVLPAAMKIVTALTDPKAYAKEHKEAFSVAVAKEFAPAGKEAAAVRIAQAAFPQDRA